MVGTGRFELPILAAYASEAYAYTNSATCPWRDYTIYDNIVPLGFTLMHRRAVSSVGRAPHLH